LVLKFSVTIGGPNNCQEIHLVISHKAKVGLRT